ncbi:hypothetical protein PSCICE_30760 [Pseudomonas cichorii]|nr:hypothetical protein PSCICE_30760 [Pseudomonas cichorii]
MFGENSSLHCHAFDLYEQARSSEFADTNACPCTGASWKDFILHTPEGWHVAMHVDVISRHVDYIFKGAATGCQDEPQIIPRCQKLLLRVFNNRQLGRPAYLASAVERFSDFYRGRVTRLFIK